MPIGGTAHNLPHSSSFWAINYSSEARLTKELLASGAIPSPDRDVNTCLQLLTGANCDYRTTRCVS